MNAPKVKNEKTAAVASPVIAPQAKGALKQHIGQILIAKGILSEDQLRIALLEQLKNQKPVGQLLVGLGFISEAILTCV